MTYKIEQINGVIAVCFYNVWSDMFMETGAPEFAWSIETLGM
jgi:hypothetical protein